MYIHFWRTYNAQLSRSDRPALLAQNRNEYICQLNIQIYTKCANIMYILLVINRLAYCSKSSFIYKAIRTLQIIYNFAKSPFSI